VLENLEPAWDSVGGYAAKSPGPRSYARWRFRHSHVLGAYLQLDFGLMKFAKLIIPAA